MKTLAKIILTPIAFAAVTMAWIAALVVGIAILFKFSEFLAILGWWALAVPIVAGLPYRLWPDSTFGVAGLVAGTVFMFATGAVSFAWFMGAGGINSFGAGVLALALTMTVPGLVIAAGVWVMAAVAGTLPGK